MLEFWHLFDFGYLKTFMLCDISLLLSLLTGWLQYDTWQTSGVRHPFKTISVNYDSEPWVVLFRGFIRTGHWMLDYLWPLFCCFSNIWFWGPSGSQMKMVPMVCMHSFYYGLPSAQNVSKTPAPLRFDVVAWKKQFEIMSDIYYGQSQSFYNIPSELHDLISIERACIQ